MRSHLWKRFDLIVIDEVHAVAADASYQSAPFYVQRLVNETCKRFEKGESTCRVIIMTGTPEIIKNFNIPKDGNPLDLMKQCRNIIPKELSFIDSEVAKQELLALLKNGKKAIYFSNHINSILSFYKENLSDELRKHVVCSFSDKDKLKSNDSVTDKIILEKMNSAQDNLKNEQRLPNDVWLFMTTSKNKEGINIKNNDIKAMYVESHAEVDIIQMAGRVREGIDRLNVITDSSGFGAGESKFEKELSELGITAQIGSDKKIIKILDICTDFYKRQCKKHKIPAYDDDMRKPAYCYDIIRDYIEYVQKKFPYIKFDFFADKFVFYSMRSVANNYYENQKSIFKKAIGNDDEKESTEYKKRLEGLAKTWFPDIRVVWGKSEKERVNDFLIQNDLIGIPLDKEKIKEIKDDLKKILGKSCAQLRSKLRIYGYDLSDMSHNKESGTYGMRKIEII